MSVYNTTQRRGEPILVGPLPREPNALAPAVAAKPAYTIIKQAKSRWWEVRE
jgi:hypothetical protein